MTSSSGGYQVDRLPRVLSQIRELAKRAAKAGVQQLYLDSLMESVRKLREGPLSFADPVYNTQKEGGVTCHAIEGPLVVHCVVYQIEKVVLVLDIKPLPGSKLEQS